MAIYWNDGTELYHYGILGQKWGVRRYQNPDGTLTEEGKKRYQKQYDALLSKAEKNVNKQSTRLYAEAYNRMAKELNEGGIKDFNEKFERKHGKDTANVLNDLYLEQLEKYQGFVLNDYLKDVTFETLINDPNYIKAEEIGKELERKYGKNAINRLTIVLK